MKLDKFSQPVFQEQDIFNLLYENKLDLLYKIIAEDTEEIEKLIQHSELPIQLTQTIDYSKDVSEFDTDCQTNWNIPNEYKTFDIEGFLVHICPKQHYQRLVDELQEYRARQMLDLLRWLKYFVDTCRKNNVVWGVGRGSSVASYVLFLIGVHKIDSIKYKLDWQEFLR